MKISVIIPSYKPKYYLWECLVSLRNQTFPSENFEILLVLNGCHEPYQSQIEEFVVENGMRNVCLIQTDQPGVSNARNIGLDHAKGEYVAFIDDDDFVSPSYLEELYEKASPDTISLCYPYAFKDGALNTQLPYAITDVYECCSRQTKQLYISSKIRKYFSGSWMKLIPMSFIQRRRFDIRFRNGEDALFMFLISDCFRHFAFTSPSAIYYRRYRKGSAIFNKRSLGERIWTCLLRLYCYTKFFIHSPFKYNFLFFASRIIGVVHSIRKVKVYLLY